jgi:hypothetical protein
MGGALAFGGGVYCTGRLFELLLYDYPIRVNESNVSFYMYLHLTSFAVNYSIQ